MKRHFVREIHGQLGKDVVESWDYPRGITAAELEGLWVAECLEDDDGRGVLVGIAWMIPGPGDSQVQVHACSPRGRVLGTRRNLQVIETLAETVMAADRLYSVLPIGELAAQCGDALSGLPIPAMRRYFRMRGWSLDEIGAYKDLGVPEVLH